MSSFLKIYFFGLSVRMKLCVYFFTTEQVMLHNLSIRGSLNLPIQKAI